MRYRITHQTTYRYTSPVSLCHNLAHLTPRVCSWQNCTDSQIHITPQPAVISAQIDYFGNPTHFFTIQEPHRLLNVKAEHHLEVFHVHHRPLEESPPWEFVREALLRHENFELMQAYSFVFDSPYIQPSREIRNYVKSSFPPNRPFLLGVFDLTTRIHTDFHYDPTATTVTTPLQEMFIHRRGVCQDFAHLQIGCLRSLGLAARYVSGYLSTMPPPGQPRLIGADASHAWLSVYCPGWGWVDFDPTNNLIPQEKHVTLAWGRDYDDVSPIKGVILGGGKNSVSVGVDVIPESELLGMN